MSHQKNIRRPLVFRQVFIFYLTNKIEVCKLLELGWDFLDFSRKVADNQKFEVFVVFIPVYFQGLDYRYNLVISAEF